jgi:putative restriction endonuclease
MPPRTYGEIPGFPPGSQFTNRERLHAARVHRPLQAGISGGADGADSIVVSGGYVDDQDLGIEIVYTGHGGNDPATKRQVADQELVRGNAGLARSELEGFLVRVIRGAGGDPLYSPHSGFRYDGLFRVVDHWHDRGKDGYRIWRFRLESAEPTTEVDDEARSPVPRSRSVMHRLMRRSELAVEVKLFHQHQCQFCGIRLTTPAGPYAEAAHIRGLGRPHDGPDEIGNMLCLCPNHHVLFDAGAIYVDADGTVRETVTRAAVGELRTLPRHAIDERHLAYHREHYA